MWNIVVYKQICLDDWMEFTRKPVQVIDDNTDKGALQKVGFPIES